MYQMYAYQKKYGANNVTLLYPRTDKLSPEQEIEYCSEDHVTVRVNLIDLFCTPPHIDKLRTAFDRETKKIT